VPAFAGRRLARCLACGLVHAAPMPTQTELDAYYRRDYWGDGPASVNPLTRAYYLAQAHARLDFLGGAPAEWRTVLDVGAGTGALLASLRARGFAGRYDAVEPDETLGAEIASWQAGTVYPSLARVTARDYDLIVLSHVLEHMPDPASFLRGIVRLASSRGRLYVEVPNEDQRYKPSLEGHLLFFGPDTLRKALEPHGEVLALRECGKRAEILKAELAAEEVDASSFPRNLLPRRLKSALKRLLGRQRPGSIEDIRAAKELDAYGEGRQWLRAVVSPRPATTRAS
jgi:SAM-dependent methyltransferase